MDKIISCCGCVCSDCKLYPDECKGCFSIQGKAYWLQYTDADRCPIYQCCVDEKHNKNCGQCKSLPCEKWHKYIDPSMSDEQVKSVDGQRIATLKSL